jgi:hypothetical protein
MQYVKVKHFVWLLSLKKTLCSLTGYLLYDKETKNNRKLQERCKPRGYQTLRCVWLLNFTSRHDGTSCKQSYVVAATLTCSVSILLCRSRLTCKRIQINKNLVQCYHFVRPIANAGWGTDKVNCCWQQREGMASCSRVTEMCIRLKAPAVTYGTINVLGTE